MKEQTKEMTPLIKVLQELDYFIKNGYAIVSPKLFRDKVEKLLPEERKAIEDAWKRGATADYQGTDERDAEDYFTDKYGQ